MIYLLYFVSGIAALAAEVVWSRMLCRVLGSEAWAVALVLSAFLGGMGLGALAMQTQLRRLRNPLALFAAVEFAAAACTLGYTFFLDVGAPVLRGAAGEWLAAGLLVLGTMPLGAGFPVLVTALAGGGDTGLPRLNRTVRRLYGVNALGAALGGLTAGLLGVALLGERNVLLGAALLQAGVATGAALLSRGSADDRRSHKRGAAGPQGARASGEATWTRFAPYLFVSGFVVFFWEVLWTRILVLTVGSSVYAFSLVAASVILGIGLGSLLLGGRLLLRHGAWVLPLSATLVTLAAYFAVPFLPNAYLAGVRLLGVSPLACGALGAGLVVLLPNLLLGSLFPWVVARCPQLAGSLYAVNSLGCVAGAFLGGPLTAGHWPLELTFRFGLAALAGLCGCGLWLLRADPGGARGTGWKLGMAACVVASLVALVGSFEGSPSALRPQRVWGYKQLLSGVYHWSRENLEKLPLETTYAEREILEVVEGREVIVSVEVDRKESTVYVLGNGRVEGGVPVATDRRGRRADLPTQLLLGMVPVLLSSGEEDASFLLIGLGSGVTLGALLDARSRLKAPGTVDVVELEPAYLEALQAEAVFPYIEPYLDARELPSRREVRLRFGDARRVLARNVAERGYAAIISQPSEPWIVGAAPLFTVEFFREAARFLRRGGLFAQWVQLYRLDSDSLRTLIRTFRSVFPRVFLLRPPGTGELILLGSRETIDLGVLAGAPRLRHVEATGIAGPPGWLGIYLLGPSGVDRWVGLDPALPLNTDGRGELEFRAPRTLYVERPTAQRNLDSIRSFGGEDPVSRYLSPALRQPVMLRRLARTNVDLGDLEEAEALLRGDDSVDAHALRARIREARDRRKDRR